MCLAKIFRNIHNLFLVIFLEPLLLITRTVRYAHVRLAPGSTALSSNSIKTVCRWGLWAICSFQQCFKDWLVSGTDATLCNLMHYAGSWEVVSVFIVLLLTWRGTDQVMADNLPTQATVMRVMGGDLANYFKRGTCLYQSPIPIQL